MPYLKFDEGTLEPRLVREALHPYVHILTTKRGRRGKPAPAPAPTSKLSVSYPKSVGPSVSSKRKQKMLYCQSFARALDRFHESPSVYDESLRKPLPPLLRLLAELRLSENRGGALSPTCLKKCADRLQSNKSSSTSSTIMRFSSKDPTPPPRL